MNMFPLWIIRACLLGDWFLCENPNRHSDGSIVESIEAGNFVDCFLSEMGSRLSQPLPHALISLPRVS
jgi:hypothetical protein